MLLIVLSYSIEPRLSKLKMVRPILLAAGSRGDVEPLFALADTLVKSPNVEVTTLVIPAEYVHLSPKSSKLEVVSLNAKLADMNKFVPKANGPVEGKQSKVAKFDFIGAMLREVILPETQRIFEIAEKIKVTVVVSTDFTFPISSIICEKLSVPYVRLILQPLIPSIYFPHVIVAGQEAAAAILQVKNGQAESVKNEAFMHTHTKFLEMTIGKMLDALQAQRAKYGLPSLDGIPSELLSKDQTHTLLAMHSQLIPRVPDFPRKMHIVGSLSTEYTPEGWVLGNSQQALEDFINAGPAPVAVTYGSSDVQDVADKTTRSVLRGLRSADVQRVVLLPGKADLGLHHLDESDDAELLEWAKNCVFVAVGNVSCSWLFPRCAMVFCHCGSGTTSAALSAGVPVLGTPVFSDQVFFVELIRGLKLGACVGKLGYASITEEAVSEAVKVGYSDEVKTNAKAFGENEKKLGEGAVKACKIIEDISRGA